MAEADLAHEKNKCIRELMEAIDALHAEVVDMPIKYPVRVKVEMALQTAARHTLHSYKHWVGIDTDGVVRPAP